MNLRKLLRMDDHDWKHINPVPMVIAAIGAAAMAPAMGEIAVAPKFSAAWYWWAWLLIALSVFVFGWTFAVRDEEQAEAEARDPTRPDLADKL